jgi:hypothetical protein
MANAHTKGKRGYLAKPKKRSVSKLKKQLDTLFSQYVRMSHVGVNGYGQCYTCGAQKPWRELQNGHFVRRQYLATRYDERNCRPQCVGCNIFGDGKTVEFAARLESETPGITAVLFREAQKIVKNFPYEEKIEEYKLKLGKLGVVINI